MMKYINGEYIEMTADEVAESERIQREAEMMQFYQDVNAPLDLQRKVELFIESIPVLDNPIGRMPKRNGYVWKPMYNAEGGHFGWEEVEDPYYVPVADGSFINPFMFTEGMSVSEGLWYEMDGFVMECIKTGDNASWTTEWFDIVG